MNAFLRTKIAAIFLLFIGYHVSAVPVGTDTYTLTINIVGNGSVEIEELDSEMIAKSTSQNTVLPTTTCDYTEQPCISTWDEYAFFRLKAVPENGWEFEGWISSTDSESEIFLPLGQNELNGNGEFNGSPEFLYLMMFANRTVTATFTAIEYDLNTFVETPDGGSISVDPDQEKYSYGDIVELTAEANPGFIFTHWSGNFIEAPVKSNTSGNNPIFIVIDDDTNITANFSPLQAVPISPWAIVLGMAMMLAFFIYRFR